jgi:hypothetical protein
MAGVELEGVEEAAGVEAVLEIEGVDGIGVGWVGVACELAEYEAQGFAGAAVDEVPAEFEEDCAGFVHWFGLADVLLLLIWLQKHMPGLS